MCILCLAMRNGQLLRRSWLIWIMNFTSILILVRLVDYKMGFLRYLRRGRGSGCSAIRHMVPAFESGLLALVRLILPCFWSLQGRTRDGFTRSFYRMRVRSVSSKGV